MAKRLGRMPICMLLVSIVGCQTESERVVEVAREAAEHLGVSRKSYYHREQRGLSALLSSLSDQASGRPSQPVDSEKQALERQLEQAHRECAILQHKMALQEVLTELKFKPGISRAEKK